METQIKTETSKKMNGPVIQKIAPFLWFNDQAEEAVHFYTSVFNNTHINKVTRYSSEGANASGRKEGTVMTISFQIEGYEFVVLNGGPVFQITPVISFFVNCKSVQEVETLWEKLSEGGMVMMELDKYPFSEKYGWIQDKFGVSWQLIFQGREQKIAPCFMFAGDQHLKAEEAITFYTSVFGHSEIIQLERYGKEVGPEGAIVHARFTLDGQEFIAMDSHQALPYNFDPAISLVVNCETQAEVDYYWERLSEGGFEGAQQCGWLQDKYGVSWQVVPVALGEMLSDPDREKSARVMQAMLQMKKIDLNVLKQAYDLE